MLQLVEKKEKKNLFYFTLDKGAWDWGEYSSQSSSTSGSRHCLRLSCISSRLVLSRAQHRRLFLTFLFSFCIIRQPEKRRTRGHSLSCKNRGRVFFFKQEELVRLVLPTLFESQSTPPLCIELEDRKGWLTFRASRSCFYGLSAGFSSTCARNGPRRIHLNCILQWGKGDLKETEAWPGTEDGVQLTSPRIHTSVSQRVSSNLRPACSSVTLEDKKNKHARVFVRIAAGLSW